jgi:YesN/AraC family two-component response regulator
MLDLGLPCMDGFEILAELSMAEPSLRAIPIVILTGYEHFEYVQKSYSLCVPAYVTKPCDPGTIRDTLLRIRRQPQ